MPVLHWCEFYCSATCRLQDQFEYLKRSITPSNVADLLHLAVNNHTQQYTAAMQLVQTVEEMVSTHSSSNEDSHVQLRQALQQPGLQEALLRTALQQRRPRSDMLSSLFSLPGMQCMPPDAAARLFQQLVYSCRDETCSWMCGTALGDLLDAQGTFDVLRVVLQRQDFGYADTRPLGSLFRLPSAQKLDSWQVCNMILYMCRCCVTA
jgi:hypothetical protein